MSCNFGPTLFCSSVSVYRGSLAWAVLRALVMNLSSDLVW